LRSRATSGANVPSQGDFDLVDELFAPGYVGRARRAKAIMRRPEGVKDWIASAMSRVLITGNDQT
jgi:hypothetical protein